MEKERDKTMQPDHGNIILYKSEDGKEAVDVYLADETVWLNQAQMTELFQRNKRTVSEHIRNVFREGELEEEAVVRKFRIPADDGKSYQTNFYNLDVIISVGYRVESKRGTQFRIWATSILKNNLVKGYTLNQRRLAEKGIIEAQQVLSLLANTLENQNLVSDEGRSVLDIVSRYARTWQLLLQYYEDNLPPPKTRQVISKVLDIDRSREAINSLKQELAAKMEATDLFGKEHSEALHGIIGVIQQTFGGENLYPSIEEKAANLLYFVVKDHPFTDGNKRIGTFLFLLFLQINGQLAEKHFDDRALVALTLLIAASEPGQKDLLIRLTINLISGE
jgi:prophage maintenance system killer protein